MTISREVETHTARIIAIGSHADEFDQRARDAKSRFIMPPVETLHNHKDRK